MKIKVGQKAIYKNGGSAFRGSIVEIKNVGKEIVFTSDGMFADFTIRKNKQWIKKGSRTKDGLRLVLSK